MDAQFNTRNFNFIRSPRYTERAIHRVRILQYGQYKQRMQYDHIMSKLNFFYSLDKSLVI